jgi:hypothetical protein
MTTFLVLFALPGFPEAPRAYRTVTCYTSGEALATVRALFSGATDVRLVD